MQPSPDVVNVSGDTGGRGGGRGGKAGPSPEMQIFQPVFSVLVSEDHARKEATTPSGGPLLPQYLVLVEPSGHISR